MENYVRQGALTREAMLRLLEQSAPLMERRVRALMDLRTRT
jgi:hypothetical protein